MFPCDLADLIDQRKVVVAHGVVDMGRDKVHNTPISPENVCVSIDRIEQVYAQRNLPCPSDDLYELKDARGSFTQWPRRFVIPKLVSN